jgi:outer membrane protein TolC
MKRPEDPWKRFWVIPISFVWCAIVSVASADGPLTLQESIETALQRNVVVHSAREGVRASEAKKNEAFTGFLPRLSTVYS